MRRGGVVALGLISVLLLVGTVLFYTKYQKSTADYATLTKQEEETRYRYGQALSEIAAIQDSLDAIVLKDEGGIIPAQTGSEMQLPQSQHDQVLQRIATLKAGLERTKEKIQELDTKLRKSGVKMAGLERIIAGLRRSVTEKEERIAQLDAQVNTLAVQVDTLETQVVGLTTEVAEQQQQNADKQRELATIYYALGSKKDLVKSGVVASKGGVLGLGKTLEPTGQFNATVFTPLDTDRENTIRIPSKKVEVLSPQPASSYMLMPAGENAMELRIIDAKEFRKIRHLVLLIT